MPLPSQSIFSIKKIAKFPIFACFYGQTVIFSKSNTVKINEEEIRHQVLFSDSASYALATLDTGSCGSFFTIVHDVLKILGRHNTVESVLIMRKVQLLVHFLLQLLVVQRNLLLSVLVAPLECLQSVSFWKTVDVNEFCSGGVDGVVNFLVLLSNVSQNFLFLLFIPAVDNALLVFEATESFVKTKDFICCFFVNLFGFLDGARLSFFDLIFDGGEVFTTISTIPPKTNQTFTAYFSL